MRDISRSSVIASRIYLTTQPPLPQLPPPPVHATHKAAAGAPQPPTKKSKAKAAATKAAPRNGPKAKVAKTTTMTKVASKANATAKRAAALAKKRGTKTEPVTTTVATQKKKIKAKAAAQGKGSKGKAAAQGKSSKGKAAAQGKSSKGKTAAQGKGTKGKAAAQASLTINMTGIASEPVDAHLTKTSFGFVGTPSLVSFPWVGDALDATLTCIEPEKNSDKFYILQCIRAVDVTTNVEAFYVFSRYGRTGTQGQTNLKGPFEDDKNAVTEFDKIFKSKTGRAWEARAQVPAKKKAGKYDYIESALAGVEGSWRYWVDDGVAGKKTGWYDYVADANTEMETIFNHMQANTGNTTPLSVRVVESGQFKYKVDLVKMTQVNTSTGKERFIRRTAPGSQEVDSPPSKSTSAPVAKPTKPAKATKATKPAKPTKPTKPKAAASPAPSSSKSTGVVDPHAGLPDSDIHDNCDAMLNQTDVAANANKFYKIQCIKNPWGEFVVWTRWGRVGETGQSKIKIETYDEDEAVKEFNKTLKSKLKKYTLVELEDDATVAAATTQTLSALSNGADGGATAPCTLDVETQLLVEFMFDDDMFAQSMSDLNIDIKKLPLGALSQAQVAKGHACLNNLKSAISSGIRATIEDKTNEFYSLIPHNFGRKRPPLIANMNVLNSKIDMLNVLSDIEAAQEMINSSGSGGSSSSAAQQEHPVDINYKSLHTDLELLGANEADYAMVDTYAANTMGRDIVLQNVWRVNRHGEEKSYKKHSDITNRRLLWHGTSTAVVAAIMKSGLRIMPHSGGRVGAGIYLASENAKSASYVRCASMSGKNIGIMFLVEAAMGEEQSITDDDWSIKSPAQGFDSVVARGRQEPDPEDDITWTPDEKGGKPVTVQLGEPKPTKFQHQSSFYNSEYLIYKESQHRIRFLMTFEF